MNNLPKILFLSLHTFSLTGGIEKVNRAMAKVFNHLCLAQKIERYQFLSMYDDEVDEQYIGKLNFKGFKGERINFALATLLKGISSDIVILSHINLLIFAKLIKTIKPKTRIVLMAHGIEVWAKLPNWKTKFLAKCEIWSVSRFTAEKLSVLHHIPLQNISILNNSLDPYFELPVNFEKSASLLNKYRLQNIHPIIYTLSRLSSAEQYKGYDQVIKSMVEVSRVLPNARYILGGKADDIELERLQALIKSLRLQRHVILAGYIPDDEVQLHYTLADVFVMPSTGEGFGISFIEAAGCGCPVIGGNKDGSTDALLDGKLGKLINPLDEKELAKAILDQLWEGKTIASAKELQQMCLQNFSFDIYQTKVAQLIQQKN